MRYFINNKEHLGQIHTTIVCPDENKLIPCDPANTDYQAYLAWVAEGNTAEEWQPDGE